MNAANVLAAYWDKRLPVDPTRIAQSMGIEVKAEFGVEGNLCGCVELVGSKYVIRYNVLDAVVRQRFTVAHEVGHVALGHLSAATKLFRDTASNYSTGSYSPVEREANAFAAELLMPDNIVKFVVEQHKVTDTNQLANLFNVSQVAMRYRLINLGLLSA